MNQKAYEVNFDGIVGPTHNYGGLSYGNVASIKNRQRVSNPKAAALQGLKKMKFLADLGVPQAVLPPHERPSIPTLKALGFTGSDPEIIAKASKECPEIYAACCSAAAMWTANAATVAPSADTLDNRIHLTPANLSSKFHRSIESETTSAILKALFSDASHFVHHPPLVPGNYFSDEGAANHNRFCSDYGERGVHLFVFGRYAFQENSFVPTKFPARQTFEASQAIARSHQIPAERVIFAQQNPRAIDAGVFHNDVISVANQNVFFYHEAAFLDTEAVIQEIQKKVQVPMAMIRVSENQVSLNEAVESYLFNSQIVTLPDQTMRFIAPAECETIPSVKRFLDEMKSQNVIKEIHHFPLHESMANGGGPACLRLRIVLTEKERKAANQAVFMDETLYQQLVQWVEKHYRDRLSPQDLADPQLLTESRAALDELTQIFKLGSVYPFQKSQAG